ncbi:MAG TPA: sigma 54-interacting transcriptional regulator, partial [Methylococcales bacterium]
MMSIKNMALPCILLVDDNKTRAQQVEAILWFMEYRVKTADSSNYVDFACEFDQLVGIFVGNGIDKQAAIINDIMDKAGKMPVVLLIDNGTSLHASTVLNNEAVQVLEWPVTYPGLKLIIDKISGSYGRQDSNQQQAIQRSALDRRGYDRRFSAIDRLKGTSQAIANICKSIAQVAESDATVVILGESGTGKEIV